MVGSVPVFRAHGEPELTFNRPEWFEAVEKVLQAHNQAALFDQSTLGKIRIRRDANPSFNVSAPTA